MPTITTHDTVAHPDGQRECTAREIVALNGFPHGHEFVETWTAIRRQIGNAVPPVFGQKFMEHIVKCLKAADRVT